jgi:hypothetical protein
MRAAGVRGWTALQAAGNRYKEGMIAALNLDDRPAASPTHQSSAAKKEEEDLLDLLDS